MKKKFNYISKKQQRINKAGKVIMMLEIEHNITIEDKRKFRGAQWWEKSDSIECMLERVAFHYISLKRYINGRV